MHDFSIEDFLKDVSLHELTVVRDDGVNRHLRFKRPGTYCMHFDILTWPGYLCYTGDMGTYVFKRLQDMLEFFRRGPSDKPFRIDFRYWAEKVESADKGDGIDAFSAERFKADVKDYFEQAIDGDEMTPDGKAALWEEIDVDVLAAVDEDEHAAWTRLRDFSYEYVSASTGQMRSFDFHDWEGRCREYSHRFLWCCHALVWAIGVYDASKATAKPAAVEA